MPDSSPISPGTYLRLRREAHRLTLEDVALAIDTVPRISAQSRQQWLKAIETDVAPISPGTAIALHRCFPFNGYALDALIEIDAARRAGADVDPGLIAPRLCRVCACIVQERSVGPAGASYWVADAVCLACTDAAVADDPAAPAAPAVKSSFRDDRLAGAGKTIVASWSLPPATSAAA